MQVLQIKRAGESVSKDSEASRIIAIVRFYVKPLPVPGREKDHLFLMKQPRITRVPVVDKPLSMQKPPSYFV